MYQSSQHSSRTVTTNTGGCHGLGTLGNVPLASALGRCTAAALSCIQWKAHHKFHVPHDIEYLQLQLQQLQNIQSYSYTKVWGSGLFTGFDLSAWLTSLRGHNALLVPEQQTEGST